jgi:hypothetical protein
MSKEKFICENRSLAEQIGVERGDIVWRPSQAGLWNLQRYDSDVAAETMVSL